jgi:ankyrin repeat protein
LPLHLALKEKAPLEQIQFLLEEWPESIHLKDGEGCLSVQVAAHAWSAESIGYLVEEWPASVNEVNDVGATPLHLALGGNFFPPVGWHGPAPCGSTA